ncbi:hypothetical protein NC652_022327 [Populus alba x Populus x berolinensis]|nr:hypothetical protein NC652_022327 [Populus alba x Populus x berolinensis]
MANKKKKSRPSKYQLKRQKSLAASQLVNNSAILALTAQPLSGTVHAIVPPNSNSNLSPPMVLPLRVHALLTLSLPLLTVLSLGLSNRY